MKIELIPIDENVRREIESSPGAFAKTYGPSLNGANAAVIREVVVQTLELYRKAPRAAEWGGFLVVDRALGAVVGTCGYAHGPEADGSVEVAYYTFPGFEGRGYASAMAQELLARAERSGLVREVVAHTLPERNASTRVLEKVGLRHVGEDSDPDAGRVWKWSRALRTRVSGTRP